MRGTILVLLAAISPDFPQLIQIDSYHSRLLKHLSAFEL